MGEAGDVLVSDFGGNLEYSNIGGQSCHLAKVRGVAGCIAYVNFTRDTETAKLTAASAATAAQEGDFEDGI